MRNYKLLMLINSETSPSTCTLLIAECQDVKYMLIQKNHIVKEDDQRHSIVKLASDNRKF